MDGDSRACDVVVVGAGLAGLTAATALRRAGRSVLVLEARDEVGGRTRSREADGAVTDFGGEWVGWAHRGMRRLADDLGLDLEPARLLGAPVLWRLPSGHSRGRTPPVRVWRDLYHLHSRAVRDAHGIDPEAPWRARWADELDAWSVADWLDELDLGADSRYLFERIAGSLVCAPAESTSLLHLLWLGRLAGGPLRSLHTTFQWRIAQGAQEVAIRLAARLGDAVRLRTPVERVVQDGGGVSAHGGGREYRAAQAVVAVPVHLLATVGFEPALPEGRQALSALHVGAGVKAVARLPEGHRVGHASVVGGDALWVAWRRGDRVTGFVPGHAEAPDEVLLADLAGAFGTSADRLRSAQVFRWADQEHVLGCDVAFAPGEVCRLGPRLAEPHGLIRFAGAERSGWPNNMEGAVRSGLRAARETLEAG
ncbi:MAG TPA: FAD-dependent oxidoreductase [Actinophytocola sp.]|jgi:monoamine oxidase|uniref:flavin monoamine oxidase family protein n=1 Tax=Actinophytocola sp. TaxID=1872138 RepID=UPI002F91F4BC